MRLELGFDVQHRVLTTKHSALGQGLKSYFMKNWDIDKIPYKTLNYSQLKWKLGFPGQKYGSCYKQSSLGCGLIEKLIF